MTRSSEASDRVWAGVEARISQQANQETARAGFSRPVCKHVILLTAKCDLLSPTLWRKKIMKKEKERKLEMPRYRCC